MSIHKNYNYHHKLSTNRINQDINLLKCITNVYE